MNWSPSPLAIAVRSGLNFLLLEISERRWREFFFKSFGRAPYDAHELWKFAWTVKGFIK